MKKWLAKFLHRPQRMTREELLSRIEHDKSRFDEFAHFRSKQRHERARELNRVVIELDMLSDDLRKGKIDANEAALKWREILPRKRLIEIS